MSKMENEKLKVGKVPNEGNLNIPRLRFPGFEGEWKVKKLGEMADKVNSGKTPLGGEAVYTKEGVLFIRSQNVNNNKLELENSVFIPELINNQMKNSIVQANDILLNITGASLGRSCVVPNDFKSGNVNQHVCIIRLNKQYNPRFVQLLFSSSKGQIIFTSLQTGSGREGLNFESIKSIKFSIPIPDEQQKIASFLSLIDERITTQNKIIEELKVLKTTVAKKIFSQKLRFKDDVGNDFQEWEEKKLGDIGEVVTGKTPSTKDLDLWDGNIQFVTPTDINESKYQYLTERTIKKTEKLKILPTKSIMFTCIASIGKMSLSLKPCVTNQQINSIIPNLAFNNEFVFYAIANISEFIKSTQSSSTMPIINKTEFSKFIISVPSLELQTKIANFLSSIDEKIQTEKQILELLEKQKKYLLQQMFI